MQLYGHLSEILPYYWLGTKRITLKKIIEIS
jgi:hypothetical protein